LSAPLLDLCSEILLESSGAQVTPALLLQLHEPDDSGFDDLRLRDERDIFRLSSCHILASIPTCGKGELRHGFAHGLDARFDGRGVFSQHVQSGSKGDHFDLNLLAEFAVMLSHIAHVIEGEIHNDGIIDVDLHSQPMRLLLPGSGADLLGSSADFGGGTDWAEMLICVLNVKASAMEATPAKAENDLFMELSLRVLAQVYPQRSHARICGSRTFHQMSA
jgi:hypothetical protein